MVVEQILSAEDSAKHSGIGSGIGAAVRRVEDQRLITGQGSYIDDVSPPNCAHAVMVRSPHAHARIRGFDVVEAQAMPGVLAVLTGADARAENLGPIPHNIEWTGAPDVELRFADGFEVFLTDHPVLALDRVRFVGDPVALVVADTKAAAALAAELVVVDYEPLQAVTDARAACQPGAPVVWPDRPDNQSLQAEVGDREATEAAFARAAHVVKFDTWINRITGSPMEPRSCIGSHDAATGLYTARAASGRGVVQTRERLASILSVPKEQARVYFGDMGGNYGTRNAFYSEYALMPWAAQKVGRPVKWIGDRSECFLSDYQGRDLAVTAELALDADGNFLALRGLNTMNSGAYTIYFWPLRKGLSIMTNVYNIPAAYFQGRAAFTNTPPIAVYRSAGRPEAIFVMERLIDLAALQCGFDRVELRRRNLVRPEAMPYTNAVGVTYDNGDYPAGMEKALINSDWAGFEARKAASAAKGLCRGIGVANYIEVTSGVPRERAELLVCPDGSIELVLGTADSGQGHATSFPQLICEWLQVPFETVRYIANDSDRVSVGGGSHSGRSMRLASIAIGEAVEALLAKGKAIAAHVLQAPEDQIAYGDGAFSAPGGASLGLWEAAHAAETLNSLPEQLRGPLESFGDITNRAGGFPYGTHVCEVEVDADTGHVQIVSWTGVDDVGVAVNPMILHGQAHGAVAQGLGQALLELVHYDPESGQLLSGSYMDYAMPRADNTPPIDTDLIEIPASSHPHGMRPGGEGGTTPALALVINAIVDALQDFGVQHIEMPATPERVWRAIQAAKSIIKP